MLLKKRILIAAAAPLAVALVAAGVKLWHTPVEQKMGRFETAPAMQNDHIVVISNDLAHAAPDHPTAATLDDDAIDNSIAAATENGSFVPSDAPAPDFSASAETDGIATTTWVNPNPSATGWWNEPGVTAWLPNPLAPDFGNGPAVDALNWAIANGLLRVSELGGNGWRISTPDQGAWLEVSKWHRLWFGLDLVPFFPANDELTGVLWDTSYYNFYYGDPPQGVPLSDLLKAMRDEANAPAIRTISPGIYGIAAPAIRVSGWGQYEPAYDSQALLRWNEDGSEVVFTLRASDFAEGCLAPEKIKGWEYDAAAGMLTKRCAL